MMVQRNNIFIFRFLVLGLFGLILMSGCEKEKELQTDLLSGKEIGVEAYGPNPALRGQKITFVGTRLNQITKVVFTPGDRKSTRLNSSHVAISYAVFCLKKKKKT